MCKKNKEKKDKKSVFQEFRDFINKGNVINLAVGVIIGTAFTAIVTAVTKNVFTPLINGLISACGGKDALAGARTIIGNPVYLESGAIDWSNTIYIDWGLLISAIIDFILIALILFAIVKTIATVSAKNKELQAKALEEYYKKHPEKRPEPVEPAAPVPTELDVLNEIRDLLKEKNK